MGTINETAKSMGVESTIVYSKNKYKTRCFFSQKNTLFYLIFIQEFLIKH